MTVQQRISLCQFLRSQFLQRLTFVAVLLGAGGSAALADSYELVEGKGVAVCEAYKTNLNSFAYRYPMACERRINPDFNNFKELEWKELNAWENRELIIELTKFIDPGAKSVDVSREFWLRVLKRDIENGQVRLRVAKVDIDNDGKIETVLKYQYGACSLAHLYATPILVLDETGKHLDKQKTLPLLQNESMDRTRDPAGGWGYSMYDVFLYRDEGYFDKWSNVQTDTGFLHVYRDKKGQAKEVCTYKYTD